MSHIKQRCRRLRFKGDKTNFHEIEMKTVHRTQQFPALFPTERVQRLYILSYRKFETI